ncbi:MAG: recombinase family protein [Nanoarchaeota archaeon]
MPQKTKCEKCGYESEDNLKKLGLSFCRVCFSFAPSDPEQLDQYAREKVSSQELESFRKNIKKKIQDKVLIMSEKASQGEIMSRAPFGYIWEQGKLVPAKNYREVEVIFEDFLNNNLSLRKLAEKHNLSVNGLKKILTNFTYLGKVKFNNQIHEGKHQKIISSTLFNHVQNKLDNLGIKKSK